jgi:hypothetical protein
VYPQPPWGCFFDISPTYIQTPDFQAIVASTTQGLRNSRYTRRAVGALEVPSKSGKASFRLPVCSRMLTDSRFFVAHCIRQLQFRNSAFEPSVLAFTFQTVHAILWPAHAPCGPIVPGLHGPVSQVHRSPPCQMVLREPEEVVREMLGVENG